MRIKGALAWSVGVVMSGIVASSALADPSTGGAWDPNLITFGGTHIAVHMTVLKTGKVLCAFNIAWLFDPVTGTFSDILAPPESVFCSGHCQLEDGRVIFVGGGSDESQPFNQVVIFDPDKAVPPYTDPTMWVLKDKFPAVSSCSAPDPDFCFGRFYPTATPLGNGKVLVLGGGWDDFNGDRDVPLVFSPTFSTGNQWQALCDGKQHFPWYPFVFQISNGDIFVAGSDVYPDDPTCCPSSCVDDPLDCSEGISNCSEGTCPIQTQKLNIGLETWSPVAESNTNGNSAAMYYPNKIIKGGGNTTCSGTDPGKQVRLIDLSVASPAWTSAPSMQYSRVDFYMIPMPHGKVLAIGGDPLSGANPPEMFNPTTASTWTTMSSGALYPRDYHSSAVLLPDARVLIAGGQSTNPATAEAYEPPYFFNSSNQEITLPTITNPPSVIYYDTQFDVEIADAQHVTGVSLIRLGCATHAFDQNTRYSPLNFVWRPSYGDLIKVDVPKSQYFAPRGYYMLFVLVNNVPSKAHILKLMPYIVP